MFLPVQLEGTILPVLGRVKHELIQVVMRLSVGGFDSVCTVFKCLEHRLGVLQVG